MYLEERKLFLLEAQRRLIEKYSAQMEDIFSGEELTNLTKNDFNFRREIVKSIIKDISGRDAEQIIYVEYPTNFDDVYTIGDENIVKAIGFLLIQVLSRVGVEGVNVNIDSLIKVIESYEWQVPEYFKDPDFVIMAIDVRSLLSRRQNIRANPFINYRNLLWTLVHEVFHTYPERTSNEREVEINTYHWMYEHGYTDPIGLKLFLDLFVDKHSEYNLSSYIIKDLTKNDKELLLSYLFVYEDFLKDSLEEGIDLEGTFKAWDEGNFGYERNDKREKAFRDAVMEQSYQVLTYITDLISKLLS